MIHPISKKHMDYDTTQSKKRLYLKSILTPHTILCLFVCFIQKEPSKIITQAFTTSSFSHHKNKQRTRPHCISSPFSHISNRACSFELYLREKTNWFDDNEKERKLVRFLGKGKNAIIREGVVLVAPNHEYNHFLKGSAVFIHGIGLNEYGEHVTRGVIIDHPTPFTMGEMSGGSVVGVLGNNILFQGGDQGKDTAMMLHCLGGEHIGSGDMIGTSGVYEGGLNSALEAADDGEADPDHFKFFFNYVEFSDKELENMLAAEDPEGDAWISVEAPVDMILDSDLDKGDAWRSLRNQLKQMSM